MEENGKVTTLKPMAEQDGRSKRSTRDRLLDAGLAQFAQKGFDGTTISDLERAAGLKPGTGSFYRHFENKEEVLHEVIAREVDRHHSIGAAHAAATQGALGNTRAELVLNFRLALRHYDQMRDFIQILIREEERLSQDARHVRDVMIDSSRRERAVEFEKLIAAGEIVNVDAKALYGVVSSALAGHFLAKRYFKIDSVGGVDDELFVHTLADLLTSVKKT